MDIVFHPDGNFDEVYLYVRLLVFFTACPGPEFLSGRADGS